MQLAYIKAEHLRRLMLFDFHCDSVKYFIWCCKRGEMNENHFSYIFEESLLLLLDYHSNGNKEQNVSSNSFDNICCSFLQMLTTGLFQLLTTSLLR